MLTDVLLTTEAVIRMVCAEIPAGVPDVEVPGAGSEAVPAAAGHERGVHWRHQLLQSHSAGHQLSAGELACRQSFQACWPCWATLVDRSCKSLYGVWFSLL